MRHTCCQACRLPALGRWAAVPSHLHHHRAARENTAEAQAPPHRASMRLGCIGSFGCWGQPPYPGSLAGPSSVQPFSRSCAGRRCARRAGRARSSRSLEQSPTRSGTACRRIGKPARFGTFDLGCETDCAAAAARGGGGHTIRNKACAHHGCGRGRQLGRQHRLGSLGMEPGSPWSLSQAGGTRCTSPGEKAAAAMQCWRLVQHRSPHEWLRVNHSVWLR